MTTKVCPHCKGEFKRAKRACIAGVNSNICPYCLEPVFYRKCRGETIVVPLDDKLCVDRIIGILNGRLEAEPGEATQRERKFAYDLIDWVKRFMRGEEKDVGMDHYQFTEELLRYFLENDWFGKHMTSLLMIQNYKSRYARELHSKLVRRREVYRREEERLQGVFAKLKAEGIG